ncbi:MAG TPA: SRPBCC family protein [Thermoleophilaceae bacterium]
MQRSSTQQAFIEAPVERVWELVGDPNRHPEWWPEMLEIECADLKEAAATAVSSKDHSAPRRMTWSSIASRIAARSRSSATAPALRRASS